MVPPGMTYTTQVTRDKTKKDKPSVEQGMCGLKPAQEPVVEAEPADPLPASHLLQPCICRGGGRSPLCPTRPPSRIDLAGTAES